MPSSAHIFETVLFFLRRERKERFQSSKKRKRSVRNLKCSPCRHRVRRRLFRSASTGAAKAPHPQPPSSFPNCDRSLGHNLVLEGFAAPHAILMMAVRRLLADAGCRGIRPRKQGRNAVKMDRKMPIRIRGWAYFTFLFFLRGHAPASPRRRTRAGCPPGCHRPGASRAAPWAAAAAKDTSPWPRPRCPGLWP